MCCADKKLSRFVANAVPMLLLQRETRDVVYSDNFPSFCTHKLAYLAEWIQPCKIAVFVVVVLYHHSHSLAGPILLVIHVVCLSWFLFPFFAVMASVGSVFLLWLSGISGTRVFVQIG